MYKYVLFRTWQEGTESKAKQVYSGNNYHDVLGWGLSAGRGNEDVYILIDQSRILGSRQALH